MPIQRSPDVVWAAPGRVNLIGEHTDYNDGFVLPFALPYRTTVSARRLGGPPRWQVETDLAGGARVTLEPADLVPGRVTGWAGYVAGVLWVLGEAGHQVPAAHLAIESQVPVGAGLSSSAALECAVLSAMCDLAEADIPLDQRPRLAQHGENAYLGIPCGIMDQTAAILCQAGHALFLDCRSLRTEQVPLPLAELGLTVLVLNTGHAHTHAAGQYASRQQACAQACRHLGIAALRDVDDLEAALAALPDDLTRRRVRHVVTENRRVLVTVEALRAGRLREAADLLTDSHRSMRDDYEITTGAIDLAVSVALRAGALGARMTGGGFGGCVLALVDTDRAEPVAEAVTDAFAGAGYRAPETFVATPSAGAHRLK